jgi:hypothetical protein
MPVGVEIENGCRRDGVSHVASPAADAAPSPAVLSAPGISAGNIVATRVTPPALSGRISSVLQSASSLDIARHEFNASTSPYDGSGSRVLHDQLIRLRR